VCLARFKITSGVTQTPAASRRKRMGALHELDCVILDEYHYGAWRENAKELFEPRKGRGRIREGEGIKDFDEEMMPITTDAYLYLSGTPFRAIASGEFYRRTDLQLDLFRRATVEARLEGCQQSYAALPRMVLLTYQLPDAIREIAMQGEFNEFRLERVFLSPGRW